MDIERPTVKGGKGKTRQGRGFSKSELTKAGMDPDTAFAAGVAVDPRRKSCHERNVERLNALKGSQEEE